MSSTSALPGANLPVLLVETGLITWEDDSRQLVRLVSSIGPEIKNDTACLVLSTPKPTGSGVQASKSLEDFQAMSEIASKTLVVTQQVFDQLRQE